MKNTIKIALIGATGKAGRAILLELLEQGYQVNLLMRNPEKLKIENPLINIVKGNVLDYTSVCKLIEDCSVIINAVGQTKADRPIFSTATKNIIEAMTYNNIKRYIGITGLSIDITGDKKSFKTKLMSGLMRIMFKEIIKDKQLEYSLLEKSRLNWTIVRIPLIANKEERGTTIVNLNDCKGTRITPLHLASFIVNQIHSDDFVWKAPFVSDN